MTDNRYSNGVTETEYIDAVAFVPNQRCRFELGGDRLAYSSNMRILNLGCSSDVATQYGRGLGAMGFIKNIRLLDSRTELSATRAVAPWMFFKNCNHTNSENKSQKSWARRNQLGVEINEDRNKLEHIYVPGGAGTADGAGAILDLRRVFPILGSGGLNMLPTSIFQNLVIEIEFEANPNSQILVNTNRTVSVLRPVLAVDFIDNPNIVAPVTADLQANGVRWLEVEHDNFAIPVETKPAGAGDTRVATAVNSSLAFIGKSVERLLITKQIVDKTQELNGTVVLGFGAGASSQALLKQTLQVRLNGKNIFSGFDGVVGDNARLGLMSDTWGELSLIPGSNMYKWNKTNDIAHEGHEGGQQDFFGCLLGAKVADLQFNIKRTINSDTADRNATNSALTVNIYAEVHKALTLDGSSYKVAYI